MKSYRNLTILAIVMLLSVYHFLKAFTLLPTPTSCSCGVGFAMPFICLSFFACDISKTDELGSPNLTQKCSTMSPGKSFTLGSKCQISRSRVTKTALVWVFAPLWVLAASSGLDLLLVCLQYCKCNFRTFIGKTALPSTFQWCLYQQLSNWWWYISCHYAANPLYVSSAVIM